jgi:hypothetical protein
MHEIYRESIERKGHLFTIIMFQQEHECFVKIFSQRIPVYQSQVKMHGGLNNLQDIILNQTCKIQLASAKDWIFRNY